MTHNSQKILITGASSGFGVLTTKALLNAGHTVIASMRDPQTRNRDIAAELRAAGAQVVAIDVTDEVSVQSGVAEAMALAGGLDVLINNAGVGVLGLQEAFSIDDFRRLFDINLFGVQRMNRAVIPTFRAQGRGLLVHVSSLLGRITIPFYGPYNASKWALEALAENYRTELSGFGVDVALVEPGGFPTAFMERLITPSDTARYAQYGDMAQAPKVAFENFENALHANPQQNPSLVAEAIVGLIATPAGQRAFRTTVDKMGMGDHVAEYNQHLAQLTEGVYRAFGMEETLSLRQ